MNKSISKILIVIINGLALCMSEAMVFSQKITKCQDEDGKWHYGSNNLYLCADSSQITTFSSNGVKIKEEKAVKTQEQLDQEKKQAEELKIKTEQERQEEIERNRILMVYQSEDDIQRDRGNKLKALKQKKLQHENYIKSLQDQEEFLTNKELTTKNFAIKKQFTDKKALIPAKIEKSKKRIAALGTEIDKVNKEFDDIIIFYRENSVKK